MDPQPSGGSGTPSSAWTRLVSSWGTGTTASGRARFEYVRFEKMAQCSSALQKEVRSSSPVNSCSAIDARHCMLSIVINDYGGLALTGKAADLKSAGAQAPWGFESL